MTKEEAAYLSDILKAYSEDKQIMVLNKKCKSGLWCIVDETHVFDFSCYKYKIYKEPKYRPYKSAEEFLKAQKEHGPYIIYPNSPVLEKPDNDKVLPIIPSDVGIALYVNAYGHFYKNYKHLLNYHWQDGTPCGILENE